MGGYKRKKLLGQTRTFEANFPKQLIKYEEDSIHLHCLERWKKFKYDVEFLEKNWKLQAIAENRIFIAKISFFVQYLTKFGIFCIVVLKDFLCRWYPKVSGSKIYHKFPRICTWYLPSFIIIWFRIMELCIFSDMGYVKIWN